MIENTREQTGAAVDAGSDREDERNGLTGLLLPAAIEILSDGKPRSALQILKEAKARNWLRPVTTNASLYNDLAAYVRRMTVYGRKPEITLDQNTHEFRINRPIDDWPDVVLPECPRFNDTKSIEAMELRLDQTSAGDDPRGVRTGRVRRVRDDGIRSDAHRRRWEAGRNPRRAAWPALVPHHRGV